MSSRSLRIGLDGHVLGTRAGGNESYVSGLLQGLRGSGFSGEIVLYVPPAWSSSHARHPDVLTRRLRSTSPLWRLTVELPWALRRDRPLFAHFQYIGPLRSPCPVTVAIHDTSFLHAPELLPRGVSARLRLTTGWSIRRAAAVLVPSAWTADSLRQRYPEAAGKLHVAPLAAAAIFRPGRETLDDGLPDRFCLYAGRRQRRKNVALLLRAYAAASRRHSALPPLLLIGPPGSEDARLQRLAEDLGVADRVRLSGYASPQTLAAAYRRADFFCYPCRYEGFGLPVAEALASGCAVLAADEGGLPETLGDAGRLLPPESVSAWADAIAELSRDESARGDLVRRGLERARRFSWTHTAETLLMAARAAGIGAV